MKQPRLPKWNQYFILYTLNFKCYPYFQRFFSVMIFISGNCSENYDVANNILKFPQPSNSSNIDCTWLITVPESNLVTIKFEKFHVEPSADCHIASISFFDGKDGTKSNQIGEKLCGNTIPNDFESRRNLIYISLESSNDSSLIDFELHYYVSSKFIYKTI